MATELCWLLVLDEGKLPSSRLLPHHLNASRIEQLRIARTLESDHTDGGTPT